MVNRIIPKTSEEIPIIGLGTWQTFDVSSPNRQAPLYKVLEVMQQAGGRLIDSSPMYGKAEKVIGDLTGTNKWSDYFFYATKVWTTGREEGIKQMNDSFEKMKRKTMDLMQIHNLTDWKTHLRTLREWKSQGKIRYIGVTHYTDSMHNDLERIIRSEDIDFVQFNYSIFSRNAEKSLLGTSADRGVATLINRPFGEGSIFSKVKNKPLPSWSAEYNIQTWSQFFLLYIISNPAVTVVIPATADPVHAKENFEIPSTLPDENYRKRMREYVDQL